MDDGLLCVSPFLAILAFMAIRLFWPKRGVEYAYRNWMRAHGFFVIFGGMAWIIGTIAVAGLLVSDQFLQAYGQLVILGGTLLGMIHVAIYGLALNPVVKGTRWLRKRYPAVARAIERYEQEGDDREVYHPAAVIDGKRYFPIYYPDPYEDDKLRGMLILDEHGRPIDDEDLMRKAIRCKYIALETVDYNNNARRAKDIDEFRRALKVMPRGFRMLERLRSRLREQNLRLEKDLDRVLAIRQEARLFLESTIAISRAKAQWAKDHGLGRLMEVDYQDVLKLEAEISRLRLTMLDQAEPIITALPALKRLYRAVERYKLPRRRLLLPFLEGLVTMADGLTKEPRDYILLDPSDDDLQAFRERTQYALELEARERATEAAP